MSQNKPQFYETQKKKHPKFFDLVEQLTDVTHQKGPLPHKTVHLLQMVGALSINSESAVKSHARQAIEAGASEDEIVHALLALTTTIGFPKVMAGINWVEKVI